MNRAECVEVVRADGIVEKYPVGSLSSFSSFLSLYLFYFSISIPYSNFSQSIKDSWVVSSSAHVPTKNAISLTPLI